LTSPRSGLRPCSAVTSPASCDWTSGGSTRLASPPRRSAARRTASQCRSVPTRPPSRDLLIQSSLPATSSPRRRRPITLPPIRPTQQTPGARTRIQKPLRPPDRLRHSRRAGRSRPAPPSPRQANPARLALSSLRTDKEHR
jgi:hypothetical protein